MSKGFNFNIDSCVACHACIVGCTLENGPDTPWRKVLGDDADYYPGLPVHNISMACNHCEDAPCMSACPANAYYRDDITGAVRLLSERCIGCNYCFWNCPYDAPQYNEKKKQIEKCDLCHDRLLNELDPACVTACPTGALRFSELGNSENINSPFPETYISPGLIMEGAMATEFDKPEIIPSVKYHPEFEIIGQARKVSLSSEWSLIVFTYLSSLLFSINISNWFGSFRISIPAYTLAIFITLLISMFHLGKPIRAWRSVSGILRSPLSNEVAALLLFAIASVAAYIFNIRQLWIVSFIAGFFLLISIDSVYTHPDKRFAFKIHPGQAFLSGLLISSYFLNEALPFIFVGLLKILLSVYYIYNSDRRMSFILFTIIQAIIFLFLSGTIFGMFNLKALSLILLLISELSSRIYYYIHFKPESSVLRYFQKNLIIYEKAKSK